MYVAALRSMINAAQTESGIMKFKPCDLVDFMISRAKTDPLAFCVLLELWFAEIIFLLHQCEKQIKMNSFLQA